MELNFMKLTPDEVDILLERFDQTDPALQRQIVAYLMEINVLMRDALRKIAAGEYDNAHDCKAASRIAVEAIADITEATP